MHIYAFMEALMVAMSVIHSLLPSSTALANLPLEKASFVHIRFTFLIFPVIKPFHHIVGVLEFDIILINFGEQPGILV